MIETVEKNKNSGSQNKIIELKNSLVGFTSSLDKQKKELGNLKTGYLNSSSQRAKRKNNKEKQRKEPKGLMRH